MEFKSIVNENGSGNLKPNVSSVYSGGFGVAAVPVSVCESFGGGGGGGGDELWLSSPGSVSVYFVGSKGVPHPVSEAVGWSPYGSLHLLQ